MVDTNFSLVATDFMSSVRKLWLAYVRINSKKSVFFCVLIVSSTKYNLLGQSLNTAAGDDDWPTDGPFVVTQMCTHTNSSAISIPEKPINDQICPNMHDTQNAHTIERISWDYFDILFPLLFSCMSFSLNPQYAGFCIYRWPSITYRTTAYLHCSTSNNSNHNIITIILQRTQATR